MRSSTCCQFEWLRLYLRSECWKIPWTKLHQICEPSKTLGFLPWMVDTSARIMWYLARINLNLTYLAILLVTFLGWISDPKSKDVGDLPLGDTKVTAWITWYRKFYRPRKRLFAFGRMDKYGYLGDIHLSSEKRAPCCLGYMEDEILPSYVGIVINHYQDPYETTRIQLKVRGFFSWLTFSFRGGCWSLLNTYICISKSRHFFSDVGFGKLRDRVTKYHKTSKHYLELSYFSWIFSYFKRANWNNTCPNMFKNWSSFFFWGNSTVPKWKFLQCMIRKVFFCILSAQKQSETRCFHHPVLEIWRVTKRSLVAVGFVAVFRLIPWRISLSMTSI